MLSLTLAYRLYLTRTLTFTRT
uniref:Uncharacterized protein n=1 Tax=Anguilla anguilla TaxID=7936 RepID=A0A0E9SU04_ANGAN